jgi:phosphate-selective porin OprO/OprP
MKNIKLSLAAFSLASVPYAALATTPPEFEIGGFMQVDAAFFEGAHNEQRRGSEYEIRRARVGLKHESKKGWEAELEIDINDQDNEVSVTDAYVSYTGWNFGEVTFGKMKEPFGLENTTGSKNINTIERSVVTEAFKPGRNYGLLFSTFGNLYTLELGGFQTSEDEYGLEGYAFTGRGIFHPILTETSLIHLGVSVSTRDMQDAEYRVNEPLEVNSASSIIESSRRDADKIDQYSLEAAVKFGAFSIQTEWMEQTVAERFSETNLEPDPEATYSGYYVLAGVFLTGESRSYKKGSFGGVKPLKDSGAWELVARYSDIDLGDTVDDVRADTMMLGVNYYATSRARFALNLSKADVESPNEDETGDAESVIFRAQYVF